MEVAVGNVALSTRQMECLWWAARGKTSKETALILGVSERTVNFHLYNAFDKLDVHSKNAAVAKAIMLNLLERGESPGIARAHCTRTESTKVRAASAVRLD